LLVSFNRTNPAQSLELPADSCPISEFGQGWPIPIPGNDKSQLGGTRGQCSLDSSDGRDEVVNPLARIQSA
jgi:hypothetical protein